MKRKLEIGLLLAIVAAGIAFLLLTKKSTVDSDYPSVSVGKEITVRNITKGTIRYTIKSTTSFVEPQKKILKVGTLHRYKSPVAMDVIYERLGEEIKRHLKPGIPYAFRYDENNLIHLYEGSHGREDAPDLAPFLGTPMVVVEKMLELAQVDGSDVVYDLGCGDGRIVITAAKEYGARGVGIDIDPQRIQESEAGAIKAGVESLVEFLVGDAMKLDVSEATVLALYLLPESNALLRPKFEKELKPGTIVVTHNYRIPGWEDREFDSVSIKDEKDSNHTIFLYKK
ncbi:SAM-dependent methyltransferase [Acidobacteriota bacterium]